MSGLEPSRGERTRCVCDWEASSPRRTGRESLGRCRRGRLYAHIIGIRTPIVQFSLGLGKSISGLLPPLTLAVPAFATIHPYYIASS